MIQKPVLSTAPHFNLSARMIYLVNIGIKFSIQNNNKTLGLFGLSTSSAYVFKPEHSTYRKVRLDQSAEDKYLLSVFRCPGTV